MKPWYQDVCQHMWRFYFSCTDTSNLTEPSRLQYEACQLAIERFSTLERSILRSYFTSGNVNTAAIDCAVKYDVSINKVYNTVKSANRAVAEERGLMDRK